MKANYNKLVFINYIYIVILELLFKTFVLQTLDVNVIYLLVFNLPLSLLLTFITNLFNNKINRILTYFVWLFLLVIFISEVLYYSFYKSVFSYKAILYGGQVAEYYDSIIDHVLINSPVIISMLVLFIILLIISRKFVFNRVNIKDSIKLLFIYIIFTSSLVQYKKDDYSSVYKLLMNKNDIMETSLSIGIINTINIDIYKNLTGFEEVINFIIDEAEEIEVDNEISEVEYNIVDIDFDTLIANEDDESIKMLHTYFKNEKATNKNDKTGIFKDKNLIFITAEAFYPIAVDKELTPTLYKLVNDGLYFKNFYQPIYNCSTSDGEFVNLLSLLPGISTCSMDETHNTYFPYTIGNIFQKYNYNSYAFHGWTYSYYKRDVSYPNLGFTYYGYDRYKRGYKYALQGIKDDWPTSDIDVVNSSFDIYSNDNKFVSYYMSISGHLRYNFGGNAMSRKNKSLVDNIKASETIKAYIAANIEFDKSLEILMNKLEEKGILDDTVIVVVADHYPYGLTFDEIKSYSNFIEDEAFDYYRNNLIIYNSELEHEVIDKNVGSIDVLPTLLNMFDIEYDSRLLIGKDIFSTSPSLVIYNNKSWISDKGKYDYMKKKFYPYNGVEIPDNYVDRINNIVDTKFQVSKTIIQKDYYRKVLGG